MKKLSCALIGGCMAFSAQASELKSSVFGYVEGYVEQVEASPQWTGGTASSQGTVEKSDNAHEFDTPNVTMMVKSSKGTKFSSFLNLNASGDTVQTRNAWVELAKSSKLKFRIGKLYRPFGLYNERLDAVPTYIGIEAPELFDNDHLLLTRTTNMMVHGDIDFDGNTLRYALTTGNDERNGGEVPIGGDLRYTRIGMDGSTLIVGTSFYYSGGKAKYNEDVAGGVAKWMESTTYSVNGLYAEYTDEKWTAQAAYYVAKHDGTRNLTTVNTWDGSSQNDGQRDRICDGANWGSCTEDEASYDVTTWYFRLGYAIKTEEWGEITPYLQWDYYKNPEMIADKDLGGDNEAGLSDDGSFVKQTLGVVIRPDRQLAIKFDASNHAQEMDGEMENYAEIRSSFSYIWSL